MNGSRPPAGDRVYSVPHRDSFLHHCRLFRDTRMTAKLATTTATTARTTATSVAKAKYRDSSHSTPLRVRMTEVCGEGIHRGCEAGPFWDDASFWTIWARHEGSRL